MNNVSTKLKTLRNADTGSVLPSEHTLLKSWETSGSLGAGFCRVGGDNHSSLPHQKKSWKSNNMKNGKKSSYIGESYSMLCLCSDLVPVNPPTLHDEHYLHTVFIEPLVSVFVCKPVFI